jgi:hypothetical protein
VWWLLMNYLMGPLRHFIVRHAKVRIIRTVAGSWHSLKYGEATTVGEKIWSSLAIPRQRFMLHQTYLRCALESTRFQMKLKKAVCLVLSTEGRARVSSVNLLILYSYCTAVQYCRRLPGLGPRTQNPQFSAVSNFQYFSIFSLGNPESGIRNEIPRRPSEVGGVEWQHEGVDGWCVDTGTYIVRTPVVMLFAFCFLF